MIEIVDLLVRGAIFTEKYNTQKIPLVRMDYCLVESDIGIQIAKVIGKPRVVKKRLFADGTDPLKIIRKASEEDIQSISKLNEIEATAFEFCQGCIEKRELNMKLIRVLFAFDQSKALFIFTADGRIDFRELVRDLAHRFKTRIEMKQIGVRDESRLLGGLGNCGQVLCCHNFLREFHPVSIKMAKDQGLSLIPSKISGLCGRLMCCLQYEHDYYSEQIQKMPKVGKRVITPCGEGRVCHLNVLKGRVFVAIEGEDVKEFNTSDLEEIAKTSGPTEELEQLIPNTDRGDKSDGRTQ